MLAYVSRKEKRFIDVVGTENSIQQAVTRWQRKFIKGIRLAKQLFSVKRVQYTVSSR
ncbi:hypothetical protein [Zooshikella sp. RANM57]|uniref:hypothetical protein n=1 Tax=Zooshikella sp. RANM57 TaxID=3425863 RepID=UPI003D6FAD38